ncbi:MAG TPA: patatin-like phospholipase family protein, partial [Bdellovibrio sp.]|nr:patatin-like phospholipase family protein [Bdellovibrio sp.]
VETGSIAKACRASCAVPFLFHPVRINNRLYWDGGILDKPGAFGVSDQQPIVYHYLDATDVVSAYEDRKIYRHHHDTPYFLKISGVPSSGPNKLHRGKEILDYAYYKTKEWLGEEISLPGAETR